jgi:hypothetical protein
MPISPKFIIANATAGNGVVLNSETNPQSIKLLVTKAVYIVFDQANVSDANTALSANPLLLAAGNNMFFQKVNLSTTWVRSQDASVSNISYYYGA